MAINIEANDPTLSCISQANIGGVTYTLKDAASRTALSALDTRVTKNTGDIATNAAAIADIKEEIKGGVHYLGKTVTELTEGASPDYIELTDGTKYYKAEHGTDKVLKSGDMVIEDESVATGEAQEFIWNGTTWNKLGSTKGLGDLAFKDSASGTITPAGSVTVTAIADATYELTGNVTVNEVSATGTVTVDQVTPTAGFTGTAVTPTASFTGTAVTPTGSVSINKFTPTAGFTGSEVTLSAGFTGTAVTPTAGFTGSEGSLSVTGTATGTVSKPNITVATNSTATGSATVANEILTISFGNALTSVQAALAEAPTFTGSTFSSTGRFTPAGTIAVDSITPTGNIAVEKFTPTGTVAVDEVAATGSISINSITPTGSIAVDSITPTGTVAVDSFTPTASVAINKFTPTASVSGSTKVTGHTHTASFSGTEATVTVQ